MQKNTQQHLSQKQTANQMIDDTVILNEKGHSLKINRLAVPFGVGLS